MKWVEMQTVQVGDNLRILHQVVVVKKIKRARGDVYFLCEKESGETFGYSGVDEELVPVPSPQEVVYG